MRYSLILAVLLFTFCAKKQVQITAQEIVDQSIAASNLNTITQSKISFNFRDRKYTATRKNGLYTLTRSKGNTKDILTNDGFTRKIADETIILSDSLANIYANSVNSVHYFSVLPFGLNDKAVQKKKLAEEIIQGKAYYKVQVSFSENGGGDDFEDIFIYWFHKETFLLDYLAYSYKTNEGGIRFRSIKEQKIIEGIRFVDYNNYKPKNSIITLENIGKAYENGQLEKISEINLENISVDLTDF